MTNVFMSLTDLRALLQASYLEKKILIDSLAEQMAEQTQVLTAKSESLLFETRNVEQQMELALRELSRALGEPANSRDSQLNSDDIYRVEVALSHLNIASSHRNSERVKT